MALIICPECGNKVSDKAKVCVHCGYPLEEVDLSEQLTDIASDEKKCVINNIEYDLLPVFNLVEEGNFVQAVVFLKKILNDSISIGNIVNIIEYIDMYKEVPKEYEIRNFSKEEDQDLAYEILFKKPSTNNKIQTDKSIKCPTCGSSDIKKITVGQKVTNIALFGLFGNKRTKQFHCENCGYEW